MTLTQKHLKNSTTPTRVEGVWRTCSGSALFRTGTTGWSSGSPETTDGRPANVGIIVFLGYLPYFDFGLDEG